MASAKTRKRPAAKATVSASSWEPGTVDADDNPVYPEGVERIESLGGNAILVVLPDNDQFTLSHYNQLDAALANYYE